MTGGHSDGGGGACGRGAAESAPGPGRGTQIPCPPSTSPGLADTLGNVLRKQTNKKIRVFGLGRVPIHQVFANSRFEQPPLAKNKKRKQKQKTQE